MKPFKALKFLITSRKSSKNHDKSKSVNQTQDKSCNQTLPSEEKYVIKNVPYQQTPNQGKEYLHQFITTEKETDPLLITQENHLFKESKPENQLKYEKNIMILIGTLMEMVRSSDILRENQRNIMNLVGIKFQNMENMIKNMVIKSKSLKKKYEEIFNLTEVDTLALTSKIHSCLYNENSVEILNNLNVMNSFFKEEMKNLDRINKEKKENDFFGLENCFHETKNHKPPKKNKNLSTSILNLDNSLKKKFLISIQDKLKQKKPEEIPKKSQDENPENIENIDEDSSRIKIINSNSKKILQNGLLIKKKNAQNQMRTEEIDTETIVMNETEYKYEDREDQERSHLFTPGQEKKIIMGFLKNEYKHTDDDQNCFVNKSESGKENQVKFLITSHWWRNWTTYVNSEIKIYPGKIKNKYFFRVIMSFF